MIAALLIGRQGSVGFPGKNTYSVLGRPFMEYPLLAALNTKSVDETYISTDSPEIMEIGKKNGAKIIERPAYLCTKEAHGEDAFVHGYQYIKELTGQDIEFMVLLHCNAPCVLPEHIEEGIRLFVQEELEKTDYCIRSFRLSAIRMICRLVVTETSREILTLPMCACLWSDLIVWMI